MEAAGTAPWRRQGLAADGPATCWLVQLLGSPAEPFAVRLNFSFASAGNLASWVMVGTLAALLQRLPREEWQLRAVAFIYLAGLLLALAWRWLGSGAPDGGSYARRRHLLLPLMAAGNVALTRWHLAPVLLGSVEVVEGAAGWRRMVRYCTILLMASRTASTFPVWAHSQQLSLALPCHLAIVYANWRANGDICSAPVLSTPRAAAAIQRVHGTIEVLQFAGFSPRLLLGRPLAPDEQCRAVLAYLQLTLGLAVPLLLLAALEARMYLLHAEQRRRLGLPQERGWHRWLYPALADALLDLDVLYAVLYAWVFSSLLHLVAVSTAFQPPPGA